mgnify:CR=1 FL=1
MEDKNFIKNSLLFDAEWYCKTYGFGEYFDAAEHYLNVGWREGKNPSAFFSTADYLKKNPDVAITAESLAANREIFQKNAAYQSLQDGRAEFDNIQLLNLDGEPVSEVIFGQEVILRMIVRFKKYIPFLGMGYHIRNATGIDLVYTDSRFNDTKAIVDGKAGELYVIDWQFKVELRQELYDIACLISKPLDEELTIAEMCDFVPCAVQFSVVSPSPYLSLPGGYVHWHNDLTVRRLID